MKQYLRKLLFATLFATLTGITAGPSIVLAADADKPGGGTQNAFGISANFGKWDGGTVEWVYNSTNAPTGWTDDNATVAAFQAAIDEWAGVCDLDFQYKGINDSADYTVNDGTAVFTWGNLGGAAGIGGQFSSSGTEVSEGRWQYQDGQLRMDIGLFTYGGTTPSELLRNQVAFHSTAVHEIGHVVGLGHSDNPASIMFANPYNSITNIKDDDKAGCRQTYGYAPVHSPSTALTYTPPADGTNTYGTLLISASGDPLTAISSDDGTIAASDTLFLVYQNNTGGYNDTLTQVIVDPDGYIASIAETSVVQSGGTFAFGILPFSVLREYPGQWSVVTYDGTGRLNTFGLNVTTTLTLENNPPDSTFSVTETPDDRQVTVNVDVTGDTEGHNATIIWHVPGTNPSSVPAGTQALGNTYPYNGNQRNVTFGDAAEHEIFVEVNDDDTRYNPLGSGNLGNPGSGYHKLYRYYTNDLRSRVDQDGSGNADVLWRNSMTGQNWLYLMNGASISTTTQINVASNPDWMMAGTGDYNQDGKTDVVWRNTSNGQNWMYQMDGATISNSAPLNVVSNQNWQIAGTGDYDGDNNADILWRNSASGQILLDAMKGNLVVSSSPVVTISDTNWRIAATGDFNGDGKSDILWRNVATGANWIYLMDGATIATSASLNVVSNLAWTIAGTGDFNNDGSDDILWRNTANGQNWMYFMNGTAISSSVAINVVANTNWTVVGTGDYNNDGMADILWREITDGNNWMYLMNGNTITSSSKVNRVSNQNWTVTNLQ